MVLGGETAGTTRRASRRSRSGRSRPTADGRTTSAPPTIVAPAGSVGRPYRVTTGRSGRRAGRLTTHGSGCVLNRHERGPLPPLDVGVPGEIPEYLVLNGFGNAMASKKLLPPPPGGFGHLHDDERIINRLASRHSQPDRVSHCTDNILAQSKSLLRERLMMLKTSVLCRIRRTGWWSFHI